LKLDIQSSGQGALKGGVFAIGDNDLNALYRD